MKYKYNLKPKFNSSHLIIHVLEKIDEICCSYYLHYDAYLNLFRCHKCLFKIEGSTYSISDISMQTTRMNSKWEYCMYLHVM
jgi:hypothetical protein